MGGTPRLEHAFDLEIDLEEPVALSASGAGQHWFIAITGGRVTGPRLSGRVLAGGGDWAVERGDGTWDLDARYALLLDDGTAVEVRNRGHYVEGPDGGGPRYYLTTPWFRCPDDGPHGWLTRAVFVGEAFELGPTRIRISCHLVAHATSGGSTTVSRLVAAPRDAVWAALVDPALLAAWRVPDGMRAVVHELEPREGGRVRMSLTYDDPEAAGRGKSGDRTDTFSGRFVRLVPGEEVVEELAFESDDPALTAPMRLATRLEDADGGTLVTVVHEGVPDAVPAEQNEAGTRMALDRLARLVEKG